MALVAVILAVSACTGGNGGAGTGRDPSTPVPSACDCDPLDRVDGEAVTVSSSAGLIAAVAQANSSGGSRTILIEDGQYMVGGILVIQANDVLIRSLSGNRDGVILQGPGMTSNLPHVFLIRGSRVTIADLSLGEVANHGIQVQGEHGASRLRVHNVRFFNTGEQMLKGSTGNNTGSDNGVVECSLFEYTDDFGPQYYIGGIDVHRGRNWTVRNNTFRNIRSPEPGRVAEHAVHFWNRSEDPLIEKNIVINCDRGIGLGLGTSPCFGGMIRNNMIYADDQGLNSDVGIGLESSRDVRVYNNTVFFDHGYPNAVEYRFADAVDNIMVNNLTNKAVTARNDGEASVRRNVTDAESAWFVDTAAGDLHLASPVPTVVDAGETLADVTDDIDGNSRPRGSGFDIGADERMP
ncbi:hypothetical protein JCM14469_14150 [Desulfatiferula olefinivorans]